MATRTPDAGVTDPLYGISQTQADQVLTAATGAPSTATLVTSPTQTYAQSVAAVNAPAPATAPAAAPTVAPTPTGPIFIRNGSEYGSFTQMGPPGSQLLFAADDPNLATLLMQARAQGYSVGVWIPEGAGPKDPVAYATYMASLSNTYHPDLMVTDAESVQKGYEGSTGWEWSQAMMNYFSAYAPGQKTAVTVMPGQDDFNYAAYAGNGAGILVQAYGAAPTDYFDPVAARNRVIANGVDPSMVTVILAPGQATPGGDGTYGYYAPKPNQLSSGGTVTTGGGVPHSVPTGGTVAPNWDPFAAPGSPAQTGEPTKPGTPPPPTGAPPPAPGNKVDWASYYFGQWGLDPATMAELVSISQKYTDPNEAAATMLAFLRGTPWYAKHFPGIAFGIQKGLFGDEAGYRDYVNRVNVLANQYFGRNISADEITGFLRGGLDPSYVGKTFAGQAYVAANRNEIQYEFGAFDPTGRASEADLTALGNEQAGIDTVIGQKLQTRMQQAIQRMQGLFQGQIQNPSLALGAQGLNAPSLLGQKGSPDVAA